MASIWSIGGVDVYVLKHDNSGDVKLAKLTPLDSVGTSVLHYFGSGEPEISVEGWLFSESNKNTLIGYREAGTTVALVSDQGSEGNYKIMSLNVNKYGPFVRLNLAGYNPTSTTIYRFQAKLVGV